MSEDHDWLVEDSDAVAQWQQEADARTRVLLDPPTVASMADAVRRWTPAERMGAPVWVGDRWVTDRHSDGRTTLVGAPDLAGPWSAVLDPGGDGVRLAAWFPHHPSGVVAYGVVAGGSEAGELRLAHVDGRAVDDVVLPFTTLSEVAWFPDGASFLFNAPGVSGGERAMCLFRHTIGEPPPASPEPVACQGMYNAPHAAADGRYAVLVVGAREKRPTQLWSAASGAWAPFLPETGDHVLGELRGDEYVAVSMVDSDRGRIVAIPAAPDPDPSTWRELLPESEAALRAVTVVGDHAVVSEYLDAACRLRVVDLEGGGCRVLAPAQPSTLAAAPSDAPLIGISMVRPSPSRRMVTAVMSSFTRSWSVLCCDLDDPALVEVSGPELALDTVVVLDHATSADGTSIPFHRIGGAGPRPTIVTAYGGFNIAQLPRLQPWMATWVAGGGAVVVVIARGGGELGRAWWEAARRHGKPRTFDDVIAVADAVRAGGTCASLGFYGSSNGALTGAAVMVRRPELFDALALIAPLTDLLGYTRDLVTAAICVPELGDPADAGDREVLAGYSPVHNIRPGRWPALLVAAPSDDVRTPPWHARKLVAGLAESAIEGGPIALRIWDRMGHAGGGASPAVRTAEWLAFLSTYLS